MNENDKYDVLIIGGGPAGLTSAIYSSRAGLNTMVISGNPPGGQLMITTDVENYPGFPEGILGPKLIEEMRNQVEKFDSKFVDENVKSISGSFEEGFKAVSDAGEYFGCVVIVASGASAKWLGLKGEQKLRGKGVSACATCDGFFFKDKIVAVVGGGDAAMEESLYLTKFATKIYVLIRGTKEAMKASKIMQERVFSNNKIEFMFNTEVKEVLGEDSVQGLRIVNNVSSEESVLEDAQGLFVAIGHKPNTDFLQGFVELGKFGYINVTDNVFTSVKGVFAAGDCADYKYRQAVTAAGLGCMAAIEVERILQ